MPRHTNNRLTVTSPVLVGRRVNERGVGFYTVPSGEYPTNQNYQLRSTGGPCVSVVRSSCLYISHQCTYIDNGQPDGIVINVLTTGDFSPHDELSTSTLRINLFNRTQQQLYGGLIVPHLCVRMKFYRCV